MTKHFCACAVNQECKEGGFRNKHCGWLMCGLEKYLVYELLCSWEGYSWTVRNILRLFTGVAVVIMILFFFLKVYLLHHDLMRGIAVRTPEQSWSYVV
jgi:hypothetical protein